MNQKLIDEAAYIDPHHFDNMVHTRDEQLNAEGRYYEEEPLLDFEERSPGHKDEKPQGRKEEKPRVNR